MSIFIGMSISTSFDYKLTSCKRYNHAIEKQDEMKFTVEYEQEEDGRWLAEVKEIPGVLTYGKDPDDAVAHAQALALRVIADRLENGEAIPALMFSFSGV
jgi:predicted RNase H-like HicB family nuclease